MNRGAVAHKHTRVAEPVFRSSPASRAAIIDDVERIVDITFSSEFPVLREEFWDESWIEVLGHADGEFDFDRLNNGATMLYNHSRRREDRIGGILSARVENGKGVARVQFSKNARVDDVWDDVKAGLLSTVSVSYFILDRVLVEGAGGDAPTYRVVWQPFEISWVDVPADWTVGMGRTANPRGVPPRQVLEAFPELANVCERGYTIRDSIPKAPSEGGRMKPKAKSTNTRRGSPLAAMLAGAVAAMTTGDRTRDALVSELATAAKIRAEEVEDILSGKTVPLRTVIEAFAPMLNVPVDTLVELMPADGDDGDGGGDGDDGDGGGDGRAAPSGDVASRVQQAIAQERARTKGIRGLVEKHRERLGVNADLVLDKCLDDTSIDEGAASRMILETIGRQVHPAGADPSIRAGADVSDKARDGIRVALLARGGIVNPRKDDKVRTALESNPFRGLTMVEIARECLRLRGENSAGMDKMTMVGRALTTSDLPTILQDVLNKSLLLGYDESPETYGIWTNRGELSDFRAAKRVGLSAFDSLELVGESGEYRYGYIKDQGETIQLATYGKILRVTRQTIINDDLAALTDIPRRVGRSADRTVGDVVYGVLTSNPTMSDSVALFHADHNNLNSAAAFGVAPLSEMRRKMALQKDSNDAAHGLNIRMGYVLVPIALEDTAKQTVASIYDPRTSVNQQIPNPVAKIGEVVSDPRLDADSGTAFYGVATNDFDTIEVAFLDGNDMPFLEQREGWSVDGVEWKVRLDVAAAARDFRGLQKNPGS